MTSIEETLAVVLLNNNEDALKFVSLQNFVSNNHVPVYCVDNEFGSEKKVFSPLSIAGEGIIMPAYKSQFVDLKLKEVIYG